MFQKGKSGNIKGRPKGALNKRTKALRLLLDEEAKELIRKAIDMAKAGDMQALRLCIERILPPVKDAPVNIELSDIGETISSVAVLSKEIIAAVTRGDITPSEGDTIMGMIDKYGKAIETKDLEVRIAALERAVEKRGSDTR